MQSYCDKCSNIHPIPIGRRCTIASSLPDHSIQPDSSDTDPADDRINSAQPLQTRTSSKTSLSSTMSEQAPKKKTVALGKASKQQTKGKKSKQPPTSQVTSDSDEYFEDDSDVVEMPQTQTERGIIATMATINATLGAVNTRLTQLEKQGQRTPRRSRSPVRAASSRPHTASPRSTSQPVQVAGPSRLAATFPQILPLSTLDTLRRDQVLQRQVDARLEDMIPRLQPDNGTYLETLTNQLRLKSGRSRVGTEAPITSVTEWPQDFVFVGLERNKCKYDDLDLAQWCAGFSAIITLKMHAGQHSLVENMLNYFADCMQEVVDMGFLPVRGAHAVVLSHIETGRLSWEEKGAPAALRRMYVSRTPAAVLSPGDHVKVVASISKTPCIPYNKGTCTKGAEHTSKNGKVSHICMYCQAEGKLHRHPEIKCRSKPK